MKRKTGLWLICLTSILFILMSVSCACIDIPGNSTDTGIKYKKYENKKYDYLFYYPSNWRTKKLESGGVVMVFSKTSDLSIAVAFIALSVAGEKQNVQEQANDFFNDVLKEDYIKIEDYKDGVSPYKPWQWHQSYTGYEPDGFVWADTYYYILDSEILYWCSLNIEVDEVDELTKDGSVAEAIKIIESFRLTHR